MLTTADIKRILKGDRYFLGVFAVDRLPVVRRFPATLIVNTDPARMGGEHWVAFHLIDGKMADYFCSFGFPPLIKELQSFLARYGSMRQRYNNCTLQDSYETDCGNYCIQYVRSVSKSSMELPEFVAFMRRG